MSPLGEKITLEILEQFNLVKDYLKGETLLQLGSCANNPWFNVLDYRHKWLASPLNLKTSQNLQCSFSQLPLSRNSVDCVLVPLTLELSANPLSVIDEIDRIVKPMGYVVFLSLNPWSLWGLATKTGVLDCYSTRKINMRTSFRLNRIFLQRGYRQCSLNYFCYLPPINNASLIKKFFFLEEIGKMIWPVPSGFYCYIAQKFELISPAHVVQPTLVSATKDYKAPLQPVIN